MSPLDSVFLRMEHRETSLHIASMAIFEGPPPAFDEIEALFIAKLRNVPRYRQVVREIPLGLGRPVWIDDPRFSLRNHLLHTALPEPGSTAQFEELIGRLMSRQLDRSRPLWDCWIVEGLEDDRWALVNRVHHCMVDGIAGTDLLMSVLDESPDPTARRPDVWSAAPRPSRTRLLTSTARTIPRHPLGAVRRITTGLGHPRATAGLLFNAAHGVIDFAALARPATASSLSGPLGSSRCWAGADVSLDDVRTIRRSLGGTVNDVVLAAITTGFRDLLISRGEAPTKHSVRSLVPVSVRTDRQRGQADNQISAVVAELPVHITDPVPRLDAVRTELDRLKVSGEAQAGGLVSELARFVPPMLLSAGLRGIFRVPQRMVVTVTTNVPGPAIPLYAAGRRLMRLYPYVPIADRVRIAVAISSYAGVLYFGVTADHDSTPDIAVLASGIENGLRDLLNAAVEEDGRGSGVDGTYASAGRGLRGFH